MTLFSHMVSLGCASNGAVKFMLLGESTPGRRLIRTLRTDLPADCSVHRAKLSLVGQLTHNHQGAGRRQVIRVEHQWHVMPRVGVFLAVPAVTHCLIERDIGNMP